MELLTKKYGLILVLFLFVLSATAQTEISNHFSNSYKYESTGDYRKAIQEMNFLKGYDYHKALRLGWLYYLSKDFESSKKYYNQAISLSPKSVEALLGICYPLEVQNKTEELEIVYKKILLLDKNNSKINYALGNIYYYKKNFKLAEKYYDIVIQLYPSDYYSTLMGAWTKYFLGKKAEALKLFNHVLIISPTDQSAKYGLNLLK